MSDARPGSTVPNALRDKSEYGKQTHIERLNGTGNPADGTGTIGAPGAPPPSGDPDEEPLPYHLLAAAFHDGVFRRAGETVWLLLHQVGAHHAKIEAVIEEVVEEVIDATLDRPRRRAIVLDVDHMVVSTQPAPRGAGP